jgi:nitrite reductase/ring-hydroxylating ferredoxin subunit
MFKNTPKILAHQTSVKNGNFVTPDYILSKVGNQINLFNRFCPHRAYPLALPGEVIKENIVCKFHGFTWDQQGTPVNNDRNIKCGNASVGRSGLVLKNFIEPDNSWVNDLAAETNLEYSHTCTGKSTGSSLWMMEIQTDLLHIRNGDVHPRLSTLVDLDNVKMEEGNNWVLQTHKDGWWLIIYPWTFVEWSLGCLGINTVTPADATNEFNFTWTTQFYFDPAVTQEKRDEFVTLEDVFKEDVVAVESQKGPYYPLNRSSNRLEDHCVHYSKWVKENKLTQVTHPG